MAGTLHFVVELEAHPEARSHRKEARQAEVIFGSAAALAAFHLREVRSGNAGGCGDILLAGGPLFKGFAEGLGKGVRQWLGGSFHGACISVVIANLDGSGIRAGPSEGDAPLRVDADAVLSGAVATEGFQTIAGWDAKVVEFGGGVEWS